MFEQLCVYNSELFQIMEASTLRKCVNIIVNFGHELKYLIQNVLQ